MLAREFCREDGEGSCEDSRLKQFRSATPRTSVAQHWALLYVPAQTRVWRGVRAGAGAGIAEIRVVARVRVVRRVQSMVAVVLMLVLVL